MTRLSQGAAPHDARERLEAELIELSHDLATETLKAKHRRRAQIYVALKALGAKRDELAAVAGVTPKAVDWAVVNYNRRAHPDAAEGLLGTQSSDSALVSPRTGA